MGLMHWEDCRRRSVIVITLVGSLGGLGNASGQDRPIQPLAIDSSNITRIGQQDGAQGYLFDGITGIIGLPNGSLVVANCGTGELRLYSSAGEILGSTGRIGAGPGEFSMLSGMFAVDADTIAVWDRLLRRITLFDSGLNELTSFNVGMRIEPAGRSRDGRYIGMATALSRDTNFDPEGSLVRRPAVLASFNETGAVDTIASLPGHESWVWGRGSSLGHGAYRSMSLAVMGGRILVGSQESSTVRVLSTDGSVIDQFQTVTSPLAVSQEMREQHARRRSAAASTEEARRRMVSSELGRDWPSTLAAYGTFRLDDEDGVWVQDPFRVGVIATRWTRYVEGQPEAQVVLPARFWPLAFGERWVAGVTVDDLDVQRVVRFGLRTATMTGEPPEYDVLDTVRPGGSRAGCFVPA